MNPHQSTTMSTETETIRSTDQDALSSRLSTQLRNYPPSDPFLIPLISKVIKLKKMLIETNNTEQSSFGLKLKQGRELKKTFFNLFDDSIGRSGSGAGFSSHPGAGPLTGGLRGSMSGSGRNANGRTQAKLSFAINEAKRIEESSDKPWYMVTYSVDKCRH
ncbi:unnamed protein product [Ambrosiozyma monospora]|uniref:Unnamed protein product n=1 Tax=Ambrosiozyma monospora TaxID=43982 RepID=A0ACB5TU74_AMBMO|nr:unnamed protein product [Ambrosiozyma monospora]